MSGIDSPLEIDLVLQGPDGEFVLMIADTRPVSGLPADIRLLREKIHTYVAFALDGELVREFPDAAGRPVVVHFDYSTAPGPAVMGALDQLALSVEAHGLTLVWGRPGPD